MASVKFSGPTVHIARWLIPASYGFMSFDRMVAEQRERAVHLVTKSYLQSFCRDLGASFDEAKNFEAFANYCVFSKFSGDSVEVADLVYEGADPGIDGAFVFLDDRAIFSVEEMQEIFQGNRREYGVNIVFTQAKSSTSWKKMEIDSFIAAIADFMSESPAQPHSQYLEDVRRMIAKVFENIGRIRNGRPDMYAYFVSAADDTNATEINAAFRIGEDALKRLGYSNETKFIKAHKDILHDLWLAAGGPVEAKLPTVGYAPFPAAPNITNAYVATVLAKDFVSTVLKNADGSARKKLFEENVRDFLGVDADVNSEIARTLDDSEKKSRFGLMNNGVTIVASSVRVAGQEIYIRDFQIVNGCQTSNVLISLDDKVDSSVSLMVKLIEADEPSVIDDIVRATNRQSKVEDAQFVSTLGALRRLEQYFNARGVGEPNRLYFERRKGQYGPENIAPLPRCGSRATFSRPR